jgi:hypothetical protein
MMGGEGSRPPLPIVPAAPPPHRCSRCEGEHHEPDEMLYEYDDILFCYYCCTRLPWDEFCALAENPGCSAEPARGRQLAP